MYVVALVLIFGGTATLAYLNDWDEPLLFTCPRHQSISRIRSEHDNGPEDRRWDMDCRKLPSGASMASESCQWTRKIFEINIRVECFRLKQMI